MPSCNDSSSSTAVNHTCSKCQAQTTDPRFCPQCAGPICQGCLSDSLKTYCPSCKQSYDTFTWWDFICHTPADVYYDRLVDENTTEFSPLNMNIQQDNTQSLLQRQTSPVVAQQPSRQQQQQSTSSVAAICEPDTTSTVDNIDKSNELCAKSIKEKALPTAEESDDPDITMSSNYNINEQNNDKSKNNNNNNDIDQANNNNVNMIQQQRRIQRYFTGIQYVLFCIFYFLCK